MSSAHLWECLRKNGSGWVKLGSVRFRKQGSSLCTNPRRSEFVLGPNAIDVRLVREGNSPAVVVAEATGSERKNAKVKTYKLSEKPKLPKDAKKVASWAPRVIKQMNRARSIRSRVAASS